MVLPDGSELPTAVTFNPDIATADDLKRKIIGAAKSAGVAAASRLPPAHEFGLGTASGRVVAPSVFVRDSDVLADGRVHVV